MDVGGWLRSLGLGQYEAVFRENEIDGAVSAKLTVDDLKDLGVAVSATGARSCRRSGAEGSALQPCPHVRRRPCRRGRAPAHRHVLRPRRLDRAFGAARSEDMRQVIRAYQDACSGVVARYRRLRSRNSWATAFWLIRVSTRA